jgi:LysM repeat protein
MAVKNVFRITLAIVILAAGFAFPRSAAAAPAAGVGGCGATYVVQPGDWLIKIANFCGVTLQDLYNANPGLIYQIYIYPGQVLNIPTYGYVPPAYTPPAYTPPAYTPPNDGRQYCTNSVCFNHPNMVVTLSVNSTYIAAKVPLKSEFTLYARVHNNGSVPLSIVGYTTPPAGIWLEGHDVDCPEPLPIGGTCNEWWIFSAQESTSAWIRVYIRGFFTDINGYQRITQSPAFQIIVD